MDHLSCWFEYSNKLNLNKYNELLYFWFYENKDNWFRCSQETDKNITKKYTNMLYEQFTNDELNYQNDRITLARIILCDQISRHVFRNKKENIKIYDELVLKIIENSNILSRINNFLPEERCFILLPYRHTFQEKYINICLKYINEWRAKDNHPIYKRFYQATIKSLCKINNEKDLLYIPNANYSFREFLDTESEYYKNNISFDNNYFNVPNENSFEIYKIFESNIQEKSGIIAVSISGGVDSMVCLHLLRQLTKKYPEIIPVAISIDYNNRKEQENEIYMVNKFCKALNIKHFVRKITEISRTRDGDREFYESITRDIRFSTYLKAGGPVILGHNLEDSLENIFSNIKKRKNYENLFGMDVTSCEKGVKILRPLLGCYKKKILEYANHFMIPYTFDSTPKWSERGKMRDILIPFINNFDSSIITGF